MFLKKVFPKLALATFAATAIVVPQSAAVAALHTNVQPQDIHAPAYNSSCVIFKLEGVAIADPNVGSSPYIALPRTHPQFAETFAILLSASASKRLTNVLTEGSACGYASLNSIAIL